MPMENNKDSLSAKRRCVYLTGTINEETTRKFVENILRLEMQEPTKDILVIIDSCGGSVDSMWSMIDTMNLLRCKVHTLCVGKAMSAAGIVLMNGTKGKRFCTPHARIMIHQIGSGARGETDSMENYIEEISRLQRQSDDFVVQKTKYNKKDLLADIKEKREIYLPAEKALEKGIVDKIITSFNELKLKGW